MSNVRGNKGAVNGVDSVYVSVLVARDVLCYLNGTRQCNLDPRAAGIGE